MSKDFSSSMGELLLHGSCACAEEVPDLPRCLHVFETVPYVDLHRGELRMFETAACLAVRVVCAVNPMPAAFCA
jgi:hypothetical protein